MRRFCSICALLVCTFALQASAPSRKVVVVGGEDNLFTRLLTAAGKKVTPVSSVQEALSLVKKGDGVLVCAENYPDETAVIGYSGPS